MAVTLHVEVCKQQTGNNLEYRDNPQPTRLSLLGGSTLAKVWVCFIRNRSKVRAIPLREEAAGYRQHLPRISRDLLGPVEKNWLVAAKRS